MADFNDVWRKEIKPRLNKLGKKTLKCQICGDLVKEHNLSGRFMHYYTIHGEYSIESKSDENCKRPRL